MNYTKLLVALSFVLSFCFLSCASNEHWENDADALDQKVRNLKCGDVFYIKKFYLDEHSSHYQYHMMFEKSGYQKIWLVNESDPNDFGYEFELYNFQIKSKKSLLRRDYLLFHGSP